MTRTLGVLVIALAAGCGASAPPRSTPPRASNAAEPAPGTLLVCEVQSRTQSLPLTSTVVRIDGNAPTDARQPFVAKRLPYGAYEYP